MGCILTTYIGIHFQKVYVNLHVFVVMSPSGPRFRQYCRAYPSVVSSCTIDWYEKWPKEALLIVANSFLREKVNLENEEVNIYCK